MNETTLQDIVADLVDLDELSFYTSDNTDVIIQVMAIKKALIEALGVLAKKEKTND